MLCVTLNGYILDCLIGPHRATVNDALILETIMSDSLHENLQEGDFFVLDRGFRDDRFMNVEFPFECQLL